MNLFFGCTVVRVVVSKTRVRHAGKSFQPIKRLELSDGSWATIKETVKRGEVVTTIRRHPPRKHPVIVEE